MTLAERNLLEDFRVPPWPEDFGRRLEGLKALSGLKWQEIAQLLGVSGRAILLWRKGERKPSGANILAITEFAPQHPRRHRALVPGRRWRLDSMGRGWRRRG